MYPRKGKSFDRRHLGTMLFDNFSQDDWDDFYNFGFECVQTYLKLYRSNSRTSEYFLKSLKLKVEGVEGDCHWLDE